MCVQTPLRLVLTILAILWCGAPLPAARADALPSPPDAPSAAPGETQPPDAARQMAQLANEAAARLNENRLPEALDRFVKLFTLREENGRRVEAMTEMINVSRYLEQTGRRPAAIYVLQTACNLAMEWPPEPVVLTALTQLEQWLDAAQQWSHALEYATASAKLAIRLDRLSDASVQVKRAFDIAQRLNDWKSALNVLTHWTEVIQDKPEWKKEWADAQFILGVLMVKNVSGSAGVEYLGGAMTVYEATANLTQWQTTRSMVDAIYDRIIESLRDKLLFFNSYGYYLFLAAILFVAHLLRHRLGARNTALLAANWLFYAAMGGEFFALLLISTVCDYLVGMGLGQAASPGAKKRWLGVSLCVNLGMLGYFKYRNFFVENVVLLAQGMGIHLDAAVVQIVLPAGISFYTFQSLSYILDVYRGEIPPEKNFLTFAVFVSFFPQLIAGPIERTAHLLPQLAARFHVTAEDWLAGIQLILWGLFKKIVIADNLAPLVERAFSPQAPLDSGLALAGVYAFALQIYGDFSGYTDIARGSARLFGIKLRINFLRPYFAYSMQDFWRRWHISLSTWLRDYLYISLGGGRGGRLKTFRNLLLTMALGGLWHGPTLLFLAWGVFHGLILGAERMILGPLKELPQAGWKRLLGGIVTFHLVCFGWALFRAGDAAAFHHWLAMLTSGAWGPDAPRTAAFLLLNAAPVLASWVISARMTQPPVVVAEPSLHGLEMSPRWRLAAAVACFYGIVFLGLDADREFIYFRF
ncbi:MAG: MBOAT family protein [Magnetococcales bacterium]|nr:MBOAT family protein [Magnetococcales bacterium]